MRWMMTAVTMAMLIGCASINTAKMAERWCENAAHCVCQTDDCQRR